MTTYAHTFKLTPPPRTDQPWTLAHIEEDDGGPTPTGVGTEIQVLTIPVDSSPAVPNTVELSVTQARFPLSYYRVQFEDAVGVRSPFSAWVRDPSTSGLAGAGLSVAELKARMDIEGTIGDDVLEQYLLSAFEQAQAQPPFGCGRLLVPDPPEPTDDPVAKTYTLRGPRRRAILPDAREITEVKVDGAATTDYDTLERDGYIVRIELPRVAPSPYGVGDAGYDPWYGYDGSRTTPLKRVVEVTGRFGFLALPENLKDAIYTLAARMHYEANAMYADQVQMAEGVGVQTYYRQLPPRTKLVFGTYALATGMAGLG